ncbi:MULTISPECIES: hydrogenase subunit MbhD domain-containing protein [unclassified Roseitalea]|uniref:hydrogenase subunit MbhD domain-containing protein n=1 Tax=unclassified Roseitalea TaxID=2639107 RepID=UPI00273DA0E5|nr:MULTISPECIES: hydrogenase subunit MbhD domain-containing protein [unclassified Roseitalea]
MTGAIFDIVLCLLILAVALAAILGRDLFGSVVFFIVYGLLVALAWTRLGAVDVALAEAAIGAGLTGVLLVGAVARLRRGGVVEPTPPRPLARGAQMGICVLAAGLVGAAIAGLDPDAAGLTATVAQNLEASGVGNPVTAVLLNFRGYDTLLETVVLLVVLIGVWSLAEDRYWGGRPGLRQHAKPGGVLATYGRFLPPLGLLAGVYVVWAGTDQPGGAFQGGTILAAVWLLVAMAGLVDAPPVTARRLRLTIVAGPALFLAVAVAGIFMGGFLHLPPEHAKQLIQTIEAGLALSIAATLALLVAGPPQRGAR